MAEAGLIVSRWLHYAAVTTLFGVALFPLYASRTALARHPAHRRVSLAAAIVALVSALAWFLFTALAMAGSLAETPPTLVTLLSGTDFGPVWVVRVVLALALGAAAARGAPRASLILAALLLSSLALTGHARLHEGFIGWAHVANDALHLLAAGAWLGALTAFLLLLQLAPDDAETRRALSDFAAVGSIAVAILVLSGLVNAWLVLGRIEPLLTTLYGRLLMLKVTLFAAMLALAAANRFRLTPALVASPQPTTLRHLRAHVIAEQALGLGVLLIVAAIGTLDPNG